MVGRGVFIHCILVADSALSELRHLVLLQESQNAIAFDRSTSVVLWQTHGVRAILILMRRSSQNFSGQN